MHTALTALSEALASAVEQAGGSLTQVRGRRRIAASGVVWSPDGVIVTAHHVLHRGVPIQVTLPDGTSLPARLVGADETTDIAVLRVDANDLTPPSWRSIEGIRVGNMVLAVGRPGAGPRASFGIVSSLNGSWTTAIGGTIDHYIESDAAAFPGFSGGPLVHADGGFIGVNSSRLLRGVGATIPYTTLQRVVALIVEHGRIRRGYLGVSSYPVTISGRAAEESGRTRGLVVVNVEPDSPAEQAGLLLGDVLLAIAGRSLDHPESLRSALTDVTIDRDIELALLRGGLVTTLNVTVGERPW